MTPCVPDGYHVWLWPAEVSSVISYPPPDLKVKVDPAVVFKVSVTVAPVVTPVTAQSCPPSEKSKAIVSSAVRPVEALAFSLRILFVPFVTISELSSVNVSSMSPPAVLPEGLFMFDPVVRAVSPSKI